MPIIADTKPSATSATTKPSATTQALAILHQGVADLLSSDGWQQALKMKARFHRYSFFNSSLILAQQPEATLVAGYRKWLELKHCVRRGEKGISILAPILRKAVDNVDNPEERCDPRLLGFKTVYVFDVSQTEGEPLPQPERPHLLDGNSVAIQTALASLELLATARGLTVRHDFSHRSALGVYRPSLKQIALRPDLAPMQRLKTFVHEVGHALLHDVTTDRVVAELEAESCAFLVCHGLGLDTSRYSFAYLARWAGSLDALIGAGERASKAATTILTAIRPNKD